MSKKTGKNLTMITAKLTKSQCSELIENLDINNPLHRMAVYMEVLESFTNSDNEFKEWGLCAYFEIVLDYYNHFE
jgi:hypothetical protein